VASAMSERRFDTFLERGNRVFVILETPEGPSDRYQAWADARAQFRPVVFVSLKGRQTSLGRLFNPRVFEHRVFDHYQTALSAPLDFSGWVKDFRKNPQAFIDPSPRYVRDSLNTYRDLLTRATGRYV